MLLEAFVVDSGALANSTLFGQSPGFPSHDLSLLLKLKSCSFEWDSRDRYGDKCLMMRSRGCWIRSVKRGKRRSDTKCLVQVSKPPPVKSSAPAVSTTGARTKTLGAGITVSRSLLLKLLADQPLRYNGNETIQILTSTTYNIEPICDLHQMGPQPGAMPDGDACT